MKVVTIALLLALPSAVSFILTTMPSAVKPHQHQADDNCGVIDGAPLPSTSYVQSRRELFTAASVIASFFLGIGSQPARAMEQKIYSANARNMARLNNGDASGGSVYDNNPTSPRARARRAMVGCKNPSARSLAGENIGRKKLSEKECNMMVMSGESADFMLKALNDLDCPTCPYGIGSR